MIKKIETSFNNQTFMKTIGAKLGKNKSGYCEIILPFSKNFSQQHGLVHGGIISTLADNACAFAAFSLMKDPFQPLTIEFKVSFRPFISSDLIVNNSCNVYAAPKASRAQTSISPRRCPPC